MKPSRIILECLLFTILEDNNHEQRNKNAADPKEIITGHTIQYSSVRLSFHFLDSFQWTSDPTGKTEIFRRKTKNARFSILTQFHDSKKKKIKKKKKKKTKKKKKKKKKKEAEDHITCLYLSFLLLLCLILLSSLNYLLEFFIVIITIFFVIFVLPISIQFDCRLDYSDTKGREKIERRKRKEKKLNWTVKELAGDICISRDVDDIILHR